jgi:hypothetical protein
MSAFDQSETSDSEYPINPPLQDVSEDDEELLREIREKFRYFDDRWKESRDERNTDLRYVCGDPWTDVDRRARAAAGRPCVNHDELGQYVQSCVNSVRENKRGIKISPGGKNSNDQTAETRQNLIRAIEYRSNGPSVYLTAFQQMVEGSYGFFRIGREYVVPDDPDNDDQQITISAIGNPNSVLYDPDCKKPDWSDASAVFVLDPMLKADFKRQFPEAQITDFAPEHMLLAKDWIQDKSVLTAEYWKVITTTIRKKAKGQRAIEKKTVMQYFTNGVEILERNPQPGIHIPIIPMIGLERWVDEGGIAKRILFSLPRLARDPQMSLAYLNSQEMEEAGLTPKSPYKGYVGQFETDKEAWDTCTKIPHAYLQADVVIDGATGGVLPLPSRENFTPNFGAYEVAKDSCRRAIQAAMGISPLPTAAQRDNQKSGVALQEVKQQQEIGSFHFVDGYDRAVAYGGRVIDSWVASTYGGDTERTEALRKPDDSHDIVRLNTAEPYLDAQSGEMRHYPIEEDADHDVAVSTGPSVQTQQQAASDFLDLLIQNLQTLPVAPPQAAKLLALAIQMKELGPKGDEMADIISPPANQAQAGPAGRAAAGADAAARPTPPGHAGRAAKAPTGEGRPRRR